MDKCITVFYQEKNGENWIPESLVDAVKWLQDKLESIPPEYHNSAKIEVDGSIDYGDITRASICIEYHRPYTKEEVDAHEVYEAQRAHIARINAEREYARLGRMLGK